MKRISVVTALFILLGCVIAPAPLGAVNKETLQLLQQVSMMQQQLRDLQDSQIKSNAIIQKLTEQILDQVTRISASIDDIKQSNQQTQAGIGNKVDSFAGNLQITQESLDDLKARITKLATDLAAMKGTMESIDSKIAASAPTTPPGASTDSSQVPAPAVVPPRPTQSPDTLYASALNDYTRGLYKLSMNEFQQYLKDFGDTPLAGNAQFYIGQIHYDQGKYRDAIAAYNLVVERYPDSNKTTMAIYKKGMALVKLNEKAAAAKEFRMLIARYPHAPEARLASQELSRISPRSGRAAGSRTSRRED